MGLPKINLPLFDLKIPSLDKTVKCRPFLVREEKILLMAQQSAEAADIVRSIQQVVNNCIQDEFDVDLLTTFDLEYCFLKLRSKSVNNIIKLSYRDQEDDQLYDFDVDLDSIEMIYNDKHTNKIKVNDEMILKLRYPKISMMDKMNRIDTEIDIFFEILKFSIESIIVGDNVIKLADYPEEEQEQFISDLDVKSFKKISEFFSTMPRLQHIITYTNSKGTEREIRLETLNDFFTLG